VKVRVNGVDFNCEVEGKEGAPWVTFSHALCNNLTLWDEQAALLKDRYRVLRYDQRGHGRTRPAPGPYTFPMLIDDAIALLNHFAIPKTHWVGLSIGGMMGYGIAADHGNRLLSLVACDSRPDAPPDYQAYFQHRIDVARDQGMDALADMTIERWFTPETRAKNPPVLEKVRTMIRTTTIPGHEGCCEALKTLAFGARLPSIRVPVLILGGAKDKGAPPEALAEAAKKIPGASHAVIADAGHITNLENPAAFNKTLTEWLAKH
jgi:3-oxoadipate enol-lactonase